MFARLSNLFGRKPASTPAEPSAPTPDATPSAAPATSNPQPAEVAGAAPCPASLPPNEMLAKIIRGRTVSSVTQDGSLAAVTFTDGSVMKIKTGAPVPVESLAGKTVKDVGQDGVCLDLLFQEGAKARITLAEQASSVLLRDGKGTFEYAD